MSMSTTRNLRLARFLKILLDFLFGLTVLVCIGLALWVALSPWVLRQTGSLGSASVPVRIGTGAEPQFDVNFQGIPEAEIQSAYVREAEGALYLETSSFFLIAIANAAKLILGGGLAYVFYLLREIVKAIQAGEPFTVESSRRIRRLGYAILLVSFLGPLVQFIAASEILHRLPMTIPELAAGPTFNAQMLFISLLVLLLAHIWSYGLDLERERALTV
ncbi:MAG: DUF2975 domain-containing protein [Methanothrix sp.]|nr:MAG: DUF2975 domain-containing protein [Methanothrix sp.]